MTCSRIRIRISRLRGGGVTPADKSVQLSQYWCTVCPPYHSDLSCLLTSLASLRQPSSEDFGVTTYYSEDIIMATSWPPTPRILTDVAAT